MVQAEENWGRVMDRFRRYAVYALPTGALATFGAQWLGWDIATGTTVTQPIVASLGSLADMTAAATPYGFHATLKPPFRLAEGMRPVDLAAAMEELAKRLAPLTLPGLALTDLDGFLALTPEGEVGPLNAMAARVVRDLDRFRAPAPDSELTRRRSVGLNPAQEANLVRWGYPYVMEEFGFHMTLTGRLSAVERLTVRAALNPLLAEITLAPFAVTDLALVGQTEAGWFKLIHRYAMTG
jgi:Protein of unknown function (DUF1045)